LFGSIGVGGFPSHEVKEGIEVHKTSRVRINSSQDALEVNFTLKLFHGVNQKKKIDSSENFNSQNLDFCIFI